jgi:hypothetical protein
MGVFGDMGFDPKPVRLKQCAVFLRRKAGVIQRLTVVGTDGHAVRGSAGKHQSGTGCGMLPKNRKHTALRIVGKVKKAVPGQQAVKCFAQCKCAHIRHMPALLREAPATNGNERRRGIHSFDEELSFEQVTRDRLA